MDKKIRIITTANDVIHSWVPAFGVKQDAIPGFVRDTWFKADKEGTYRGQCAELCGKDHGFMPIVVEVVSADKYSAWVGEQKKARFGGRRPEQGLGPGGPMARGEKVYAGRCVACHQRAGKGRAGRVPGAGWLEGVVNGPKDGPDQPGADGKPGTAMVAFGKQLSDTDLAAVITYTRNTWGNKIGDMVQPAEVKAARK